MELRNIKTFLRAAELQNFSQVAEELGYSQAAITLQIQQLENELNVQLFERIGKKVKLTEHGQSFAKHASKAIISLDEAIDAVNDDREISGKLSIAAAESLCTKILPRIFIAFRRKCPLVEIEIKPARDNMIEEMISKNDIDIAYTIGARKYRSDWITAFERPETAVFVASPSNPLSESKSATLQEILSQPLLLTEKDFDFRYELEYAAAENKLQFKPVLEASNTDIIVEILLHDNGVSFLPEYFVKQHIDSGRLIKIHNNDVNCHIWSQLIYHRNKVVTPQMKIFIETIKEHVSEC